MDPEVAILSSGFQAYIDRCFKLQQNDVGSERLGCAPYQQSHNLTSNAAYMQVFVTSVLEPENPNELCFVGRDLEQFRVQHCSASQDGVQSSETCMCHCPYRIVYQALWLLARQPSFSFHEACMFIHDHKEFQCGCTPSKDCSSRLYKSIKSILKDIPRVCPCGEIVVCLTDRWLAQVNSLDKMYYVNNIKITPGILLNLHRTVCHAVLNHASRQDSVLLRVFQRQLNLYSLGFNIARAFYQCRYISNFQLLLPQKMTLQSLVYVYLPGHTVPIHKSRGKLRRTRILSMIKYIQCTLHAPCRILLYKYSIARSNHIYCRFILKEMLQCLENLRGMKIQTGFSRTAFTHKKSPSYWRYIRHFITSYWSGALLQEELSAPVYLALPPPLVIVNNDSDIIFHSNCVLSATQMSNGMDCPRRLTLSMIMNPNLAAQPVRYDDFLALRSKMEFLPASTNIKDPLVNETLLRGSMLHEAVQDTMKSQTLHPLVVCMNFKKNQTKFKKDQLALQVLHLDMCIQLLQNEVLDGTKLPLDVTLCDINSIIEQAMLETTTGLATFQRQYLLEKSTSYQLVHVKQPVFFEKMLFNEFYVYARKFALNGYIDELQLTQKVSSSEIKMQEGFEEYGDYPQKRQGASFVTAQEMKSGKFASRAHKIQVGVYTSLLGELFGVDHVGDGLLWMLRKEESKDDVIQENEQKRKFHVIDNGNIDPSLTMEHVYSAAKKLKPSLFPMVESLQLQRLFVYLQGQTKYAYLQDIKDYTQEAVWNEEMEERQNEEVANRALYSDTNTGDTTYCMKWSSLEMQPRLVFEKPFTTLQECIDEETQQLKDLRKLGVKLLQLCRLGNHHSNLNNHSNNIAYLVSTMNESKIQVITHWVLHGMFTNNTNNNTNNTNNNTNITNNTNNTQEPLIFELGKICMTQLNTLKNDCVEPIVDKYQKYTKTSPSTGILHTIKRVPVNSIMIGRNESVCAYTAIQDVSDHSKQFGMDLKNKKSNWIEPEEERVCIRCYAKDICKQVFYLENKALGRTALHPQDQKKGKQDSPNEHTSQAEKNAVRTVLQLQHASNVEKRLHSVTDPHMIQNPYSTLRSGWQTVSRSLASISGARQLDFIHSGKTLQIATDPNTVSYPAPNLCCVLHKYKDRRITFHTYARGDLQAVLPMDQFVVVDLVFTTLGNTQALYSYPGYWEQDKTMPKYYLQERVLLGTVELSTTNSVTIDIQKDCTRNGQFAQETFFRKKLQAEFPTETFQTRYLVYKACKEMHTTDHAQSSRYALLGLIAPTRHTHVISLDADEQEQIARVGTYKYNLRISNSKVTYTDESCYKIQLGYGRYIFVSQKEALHCRLQPCKHTDDHNSNKKESEDMTDEDPTKYSLEKEYPDSPVPYMSVTEELKSDTVKMVYTSQTLEIEQEYLRLHRADIRTNINLQFGRLWCDSTPQTMLRINKNPVLTSLFATHDSTVRPVCISAPCVPDILSLLHGNCDISAISCDASISLYKEMAPDLSDFISSKLNQLHIEQLHGIIKYCYRISLRNTNIQESLLMEVFTCNEQQREAINSALVHQLVAWEGFPGAGKTRIISLLLRIIALSGGTCLCVAFTNSAVDGVLERVAADSHDAYSEQYCIGRIGRSKYELNDANQQHLVISEESMLPSVITHGRILCSTTQSLSSSAANTIGLNQQRFDLVLIEEASQLVCSDSVESLLFLKANGHAVQCGDQKQLRPLVKSTNAMDLGLNQSLLELQDGKIRKTSLTKQFRMNADIMQLSNELVYDGQMSCGSEKVANNILTLPKKELIHIQNTDNRNNNNNNAWLEYLFEPANSTTFINTSTNTILSSLEQREQIQDNIQNINVYPEYLVSSITTATQVGLFFNVQEALTSITVLLNFLHRQCPPTSIILITPYKAQQVLIQTLCVKLQEHTALPIQKVNIYTIDQCQGLDVPVVLLSSVRANAACETGQLLQDYRRVNVALTRAKQKLILIGHQPTLTQKKQAQLTGGVLGMCCNIQEQKHRVISLPDSWNPI